MKTHTSRLLLLLLAAFLTSCGGFPSPGKMAGNFWNAVNPWAHGTGQMIERHGPAWTNHHRNTRKAIEDW
jgi:hypothetical protein